MLLFFRLGLLDDLFAMVKAGKTSTVEVLKLLMAFEDESDYNVWSSIVNILVRLNQLLSHTEYKDEFKKVGSMDVCFLHSYCTLRFKF